MLSTRYPIEHIVLTFILTTLAYFHTLRQIKHSTWFSSTASLNPVQLIWLDGAFVSQESPLTASTGVQSVELVGGQPTFAEDSVKNYSEFLTSLIPQSSMHRASPDSFTLTFPTSSSLPAPSEWAVAEYGPDSNNLTLAISSSDKPMSVLDMSKIESSAWIAYAFRAFVLRLWDLTMKADSLDISVVVLGYVLMHITFLSLPYRSRLLFHSTSPQHTHAPYIWLSLAIFASSLTSFIVSLPVSSFSPFNITLEPIALSEALPFFVITVGFDKPLRLARSVFSHQSLYSSSYPARKVVDDAWKTVGSGIFRDYVIEVAILLAASAVSGSGSGGVREFCRLASLTLILDGISLVGFYSSILTVMVEVQRIKSSPATPTKSVSQAETKVEETHESPVPRLKLLLLISFLTLHLLNFLDVLSPTVSAGLGLGYKFRMHEKVVDFSKKPSTQMDEGWAISLVESLDVKPSEGASWVVYPPLYVQALTAIELDNGNNHTISGNPSLYSPSPLPLRSASPTTDIPHKATKHATSSLLSTLRKIKSPFSLSGTLGDPLLSKWIALALAISFSLNGVLLKGLSRGSSSHISEEDEAEPKKEKKSEKSVNPTFKITDTDLTPTVENMTIPLSLSSGAGAGSMTQTELEVEQPLKKRRDIEREKLIIDLTDAKFPVLNEEDVTTPPATGPTTEAPPRPLAELKELYTSATANQFSIQELAMLVKHGMLAAHSLEKVLPDDLEKAVLVRRELLSSETATFEGVPFENFAYEKVLGACCENVVGYMPLPLGIAGPLNIDGKVVHLPMATAEGTLVASTSRGCKALNASIGGGVTTVLTQDIMTRGPALAFPSITSCAKAKAWLDSTQGAQIMANAFNSTSRFARLQKLKCVMAGRTLYVRFATSTGDAMGMNMISKGCEKALEVMATQYFPEMQILSLSGNYCTDKKPAAINWIEGRGKSVVAEAVVPGDVVKKVLKTTVEDLVQLNLKKNLVGSAMAGAIGGFNAHAANIVAAMFLATGQDPAQVVESANCITLMEAVNDCKDLLITVTLPSIEVGTVGGGTVLPPQHAVLKYLGIAGAHPTSPGHNARQLARIIGAAVMAAELSLMSALAAGHLVRAHVSLNRTPVSTRPSTPAPQMIGGVGGNSGGFGGGLSPFGFGMTPMTPHTNGTSNGTPNKERVSPTTSSSLTRITEMENGKGGYM